MHKTPHHIIGPIFYKIIVDIEVYKGTFNEFVNQLDDEELRTGYFALATYYTYNVSMKEIESFIKNRVSSR